MKKFLKEMFINTPCWYVWTKIKEHLLREYGDNPIVVSRVNAIVQNTRLSEYEILRALMALYV